MPLRLLLAITSASVLALVLGPAVLAAEPPNQNDPCSREGRNTCGTNGVGFYQTYRYGIRWFGDFRGAVPGHAHTFCIDLRFWYPSAAHKFEEQPSAGLRNRDGELVTLDRQRKMAYAMWTYGRSSTANRQAAVMLYVHSLMGDGAPGEVDPAALNSSVVTLFEKIAEESQRLHGPYRIAITLPDRLGLTEEGTATIRVVSATGAALPNVELALEATGARGVPRRVRTDASGVARLTLTATSTDGVSLTATAAELPSTLPEIYAATTAAAAPNGQRLAAPSSQELSATAKVSVTRPKVIVATLATPDRLAVGETSRDRVTISGTLPGWRGKVAVEIHGPARTADRIRCDGKPAWQGSFPASGPGTYTTPAASLERPGWYAYRLILPGDAEQPEVATPCRVPAETFVVEAQPRVTTKVSSAVADAGADIFDTVIVEGLAGEAVTVNAALYGPFPSRETITCDGQPIWTGTFEAKEDGEYTTDPFTLTVPGYYTYREWIDTTDLVRQAGTACGETAETTIVRGAPRVSTQVSSQQTTVGGTITDRVVVSGLGALSAAVRVELHGPFATVDAIRCTRTPFWTGTLVAEGDGTYTTEPVRLDRVGYYTYRESIDESQATAAAKTTCGDTAETTIARAEPRVTTIASAEVVFPGARIFDQIEVEGLGRSTARIEAELYGPFASRDAIRCTGEPFWRGQVTARGDGQLRTRSVKIKQVGFYTYREHLVGSPLLTEYTTMCGEVVETVLARPLINTGRGEIAAFLPARAAGGRTPTRVRLASLGIDAPVSPAGVDIGKGELAAPSDIRRTGWWRDGATPGAESGSVLIAGHVDSAKLGAGAFFRLREARPGDRVQVITADGATATYRVVSVRRYLKRRLPPDIYSLRGEPRLVLVTCGGPFDRSSGQYKDNVVLTAVPVS